MKYSLRTILWNIESHLKGRNLLIKDAFLPLLVKLAGRIPGNCGLAVLAMVLPALVSPLVGACEEASEAVRFLTCSRHLREGNLLVGS